MPASLPGATITTNKANPSAGPFVTFDLLSGPKGSPFDVRKIDSTTTIPTYTNDAANQYPSTGALSTGIGYGAAVGPIGLTAPASIKAAGFTDDYTPGVSTPLPANGNSTLMYIGGGKTTIVAGNGPNGNGAPVRANVSNPVPYTAGFGIGGAGQAGSRDAGAGPAFTGFGMKMVTAAGAVAVAGVVEAGFVNRSPVALVTGQSVFGSATAASAVPA